MSLISANGVALAYEILGDRGPAIALTSGGKSDREAMRPLARLLSSSYRVLIWDRRNCGESDLYLDPEPDEVQIWAEDLHRLLEALGMLPAYVGGSSAGSLTSLRLARRYPESAAGLLLLNPPVGRRAGIAQICRTGFLQLAEVAEVSGMAAVVGVGWAASLAGAFDRHRDRLLALDAAEFAATLRAWAAALGRARTYWGLTNRDLEAIEAPALVFSNENRWNHPWSAVEMLCGVMPEATVPVLPEAQVIEIKSLAREGKLERYHGAMATACDAFITRLEARAA